MSVPDYQTIMLPMLRFLEDGEVHTNQEWVDLLATQFDLTAEERARLIPSGGQTYLVNRVGWAKSSLKKAGLIEYQGSRRHRITERGRGVLNENPQRIDDAFLSRYPEFVEYLRGSKGKENRATPASGGDVEEKTPTELLETSYQNLRRVLAQELLERVKQTPPAFFEQLVVDLLVAMGYGGSRKDAGQAVGGGGDGGIDGIIKEDRLGLDFVYIQAKRWDGPVSRPTVQAFAGSLEGQRARKGVLITTSRFTNDAEEYVRRIEKRIVLIDGEQLAQLMLDFGIGVTEVASYRVQRVDLDYFGEES